MPNHEFNVDAYTDEVICPVCGRSMILLQMIRRAFGENLNLFECTPCGFSDPLRAKTAK
jgi:predicted RNA-binding Zn-ribbon protein involved in translation (DUF1610 family)